MNRVLPFIVLMTCFMMGCLTNRYEDCYKSVLDRTDPRNTQRKEKDAQVILKPATSPDGILDLMEDGYAIIGSSSFESPYTPLSLAVDTARNHGADLVWLNIEFKETREYTAIVYVPSYSSTYTSGSFGGSYGGYGYGGSFSGGYSEDSHTTTYNPVSVKRKVDIYRHDAVFYQKIDVSNLYGILWNIPQRLPTEKIDTPIVVGIFGVIHGSQAEKDGLKRNSIIKSINGKEIRTRRDVEPFYTNRVRIEKVEIMSETNKVEVVNEK